MTAALDDRVVVVTGGGGDIGRAIAARVLDLGGRAAVVDIRAAAAERVVDDLASSAAAAFVADVGEEADVHRLFTDVEHHLGPVDVVVNNASLLLLADLLEMELDLWNRQMNVTATGTFLMTREAGRRFVSAGTKGRIVNVTSIVAERAIAQHAAYGAAKAAVRHLTRIAAQELGPHGITVNAVAPGPTDTAMVAELKDDPATRRFWNERMPLGKLGQPVDVANAVAFLASDLAGHTTGSTLYVDGGFSAN